MAPPAERRGGRRWASRPGTREAAMTAPRVSLPFLLLALILSILGAARRADAGWTAIGPEGGTVTALAINPATPTTLYAGTFSGAGVFNSTNGGGELDGHQLRPARTPSRRPRPRLGDRPGDADHALRGHKQRGVQEHER